MTESFSPGDKVCWEDKRHTVREGVIAAVRHTKTGKVRVQVKVTPKEPKDYAGHRTLLAQKLGRVK